MNEKSDFFLNYCKNIVTYYSNAVGRRVIKRNIFKLFFNRPVEDICYGNNLLYDLIMEGKPFVATRFGGTEIRTIADAIYTSYEFPIGGITKRTCRRISELSGFFPATKDNVIKFKDLYIDLCKEINILCVWNNFMQDYIANKYVPNANLVELCSLEPYYFEHPWSKALAGKKVLVIHPFSETIKSQYQKRKLLFSNQDILPEFDLITLKAVQTIAGQKTEFTTWFDSLEWMYNEAINIDFDVALIGCGAYGMPLAIKLKQSGKQAIHIGGALQILFGIKGNRWDKKPDILNLYNNSWVRPGDNERPINAKKVEDSCYW